MNITQNRSISAPQALTQRGPAPTQEQNEAPQEHQIKQDMYDIADRYNDSRSMANSVAGLVIGAVTGTIDGIIKAPLVAWEVAENAVQTEKIGPNLKVLTTLAAIPAGVLSAVASPFAQAFRDANMMSEANDDALGPLNTDEGTTYAKQRLSTENPSFSSGVIKNLEAWGAAKLDEGEKAYDVPLLSPMFSVIGGVVSGAISGVTGLVGGLAAGLLTTGKEIGGAIFGKNQTVGERVGRAATSPLHTVAIPYGLIKEGLLESVPRGFSDGWKHGPVKPVVDTARASVKLASGVIKEAWDR